MLDARFEFRFARIASLGGLTLWAAWWLLSGGVHPRAWVDPPAEPHHFPDALQHLVSFHHAGIPLDEAVARLAARHHLKIVVDPGALTGLGLSGQEPVSVAVDQASLCGVLAFLGSQLGRGDRSLVVRARDGVVYLTDSQIWTASRSNYETHVYPVGPPLDRLGDEVDLARLIEQAVAPAAWRSPASLLRCVPGALIVCQTPEVHRQIQWLLQSIARRTSLQQDMRPDYGGSLAPDRDAAIQAVLDQIVDVDLENASVDRALAMLADQFGIPLALDPATLAAMRLRDTRLTVQRLYGLPLRLVLRLMTDDVGLQYYVRDGIITVTGKGSVPEQSAVRLYPVHDLVAWLRGDERPLLRLARSLFSDHGSICCGFLIASSPEGKLDRMDDLLASVRRCAFPYVEGISTQPTSQAPLHAGISQSVVPQESVDEWQAYRLGPAALDRSGRMAATDAARAVDDFLAAPGTCTEMRDILAVRGSSEDQLIVASLLSILGELPVSAAEVRETAAPLASQQLYLHPVADLLESLRAGWPEPMAEEALRDSFRLWATAAMAPPDSDGRRRELDTWFADLLRRSLPWEQAPPVRITVFRDHVLALTTESDRKRLQRAIDQLRCAVRGELREICVLGHGASERYVVGTAAVLCPLQNVLDANVRFHEAVVARILCEVTAIAPPVGNWEQIPDHAPGVSDASVSWRARRGAQPSFTDVTVAPGWLVARGDDWKRETIVSLLGIWENEARERQYLRELSVDEELRISWSPPRRQLRQRMATLLAELTESQGRIPAWRRAWVVWLLSRLADPPEEVLQALTEIQPPASTVEVPYLNRLIKHAHPTIVPE